ncbi:MAG TPA: MarR family transcriptional regulator [Gallionellaceae bacterium]|nr:MarR family transcriptional regulator [Gallionellaceae bacterium]
MAKRPLSKKDFETLSNFRYQLRCFLRFSEELTHKFGITNLQYLLLLHVKGYQGREWATVGELAEKLQAQHNGVVALASRCEKLGLIYRQRGTVDKREVQIHLTEAGDDLVKEIASLHRRELIQLGGEFTVPGLGELE